MNKEDIEKALEDIKNSNDNEILNYLKKQLYENFIEFIIDGEFKTIEEIKESAKEIIKASDIYC